MENETHPDQHEIFLRHARSTNRTSHEPFSGKMAEPEWNLCRKTRPQTLPSLPVVSVVWFLLDLWTSCWWSSATSPWPARSYPSGWPVACACPCPGTCCSEVSLQWCYWSWSWSEKAAKQMTEWRIARPGARRREGLTIYLWGVEVDIFSTAVLVAGHCWLVVKSLLHIECRQLILKINTRQFTPKG